jgi:spermidine/putrescine transport system permease protein
MTTTADQSASGAAATFKAPIVTARRETDWASAIMSGYMVLFFAYMFLPLIFMVIAAFNLSPTPSVTDWQGFTLRWFIELPSDARFVQGLWNSILIAVGVIVVAIPLGLSGALILTRMQSKGTTFLYTALVSPILMPGIVLGVTTMIFWRDYFGVEAGLFTAMVAQTSFIASYCMLLFMARLQRQDRVLEEAALDLGASPVMVFRRITLPFLMPTIATASVIAFLQSIENYNTTFFAIGGDWTLVTEIGSRMRFGLSPMINAIGVIFVLITVIAALTHVLLKRRRR